MKDTAQFFDNIESAPLRLADGVVHLEICGADGSAFDEGLFYSRLATLSGRDSIKHVQVKCDSNVVSCEFLTLLPMVEALTLSSKRLKTIKGVGQSKHLRRLMIDTGAPNKIDLSELKDSSIEFVRLHGARLVDVEVIAQSRVKDLVLRSGKMVDVATLEGATIGDLALSGLQIQKIGDVDSIGVKRLTVDQCRKLEGFFVESKMLTSLTIEACNAFDVSTLGNLSSLRSLRMMACRGPFDIGDLAILIGLEDVVLTQCAVSFRDLSMNKAKKLKRIWISPMPLDVAQQISAVNKGVKVSNGKFAFCDGVKHDLSYYYEP